MATFYVDAATGNDSTGDGSELLPWATIQKGLNTMGGPGNTLRVSAGDYPERLSMPASMAGASGSRTTVEAIGAVTCQGFNTSQDGGEYTTLDGFTITYDGVGSNGSGIWVQDANFLIIQNCNFIDCQHAGIFAYHVVANLCTGVIVRNNYFNQCNMGMVVEGFDWLIEGNEVEALKNWGVGQDCDYFRVFGDGHTFRRNHCHGTLAADIGAAHVDGIQTFNSSSRSATNITVEYNIFKSFHQGIIIEKLSGQSGLLDDWDIRYNLFIGGDTGNGEIEGSWGILLKHTATDIRIYNNVFHNITFGSAQIGVWTDSTATVKNNIFHRTRNVESAWKMWDFTGTGQTLTEDYNLKSAPANGDVSSDNDILSDDPEFTDAANDDFTLAETSPCIDAGTDVGLSEDIAGILVPQNGTVDMGAYEFAADGGSNIPVILYHLRQQGVC